MISDIYEIQLNFGISNTNISNTTDISRYVCGPDQFYYINDYKKPRYVEHGNLEYPAYLEVNLRPQSLKDMRYLEVKSINRLSNFTPSVHCLSFTPIFRSIEQIR